CQRASRARRSRKNPCRSRHAAKTRRTSDGCAKEPGRRDSARSDGPCRDGGESRRGSGFPSQKGKIALCRYDERQAEVVPTACRSSFFGALLISTGARSAYCLWRRGKIQQPSIINPHCQVFLIKNGLEIGGVIFINRPMSGH